MIGRITISYLALSPKGRIVQAFDRPEMARAFADKQAKRGIKTELAVETRTMRPLTPMTASPVQQSPEARKSGTGGARG